MTLQFKAELRATQISTGRYDQVVATYLYPLPVVYRGRCNLAGDPREAWSFFQALHSSMVAQGLFRLCAQVTAQELPRGRRFRVWTDWIGHGAGGATALVAQTICSCSGTAAAHLIEMVQFTHLSLPDLAEAIG